MLCDHWLFSGQGVQHCFSGSLVCSYAVWPLAVFQTGSPALFLWLTCLFLCCVTIGCFPDRESSIVFLAHWFVLMLSDHWLFSRLGVQHCFSGSLVCSYAVWPLAVFQTGSPALFFWLTGLFLCCATIGCFPDWESSIVFLAHWFVLMLCDHWLFSRQGVQHWFSGSLVCSYAVWPLAVFHTLSPALFFWLTGLFLCCVTIGCFPDWESSNGFIAHMFVPMLCNHWLFSKRGVQHCFSGSQVCFYAVWPLAVFQTGSPALVFWLTGLFLCCVTIGCFPHTKTSIGFLAHRFVLMLCDHWLFSRQGVQHWFSGSLVCSYAVWPLAVFHTLSPALFFLAHRFVLMLCDHWLFSRLGVQQWFYCSHVCSYVVQPLAVFQTGSSALFFWLTGLFLCCVTIGCFPDGGSSIYCGAASSQFHGCSCSDSQREAGECV